MKRILLALFFMFLIGGVFAFPVFQQTVIIDNGIQIEYPKFEYLKYGNHFNLHITPFNSSNGIRLLNDSTNCGIQLFSANGSYIIDSPLSFNLNHSNFFIKIENISSGKLAYIIYCNTSNLGGFVSGRIYASYTGVKPSSKKTAMEIVILIVMIVSVTSFYYIRNTINFSSWYESILREYQAKNFIKFNLFSLFFTIIEQSILIYYLFGLGILVFISNIIYSYNIECLFPLIDSIVLIYTIGILLVGLVFFSYVQEWITKLIEDIGSMEWGFER